MNPIKFHFISLYTIWAGRSLVWIVGSNPAGGMDVCRL